MDDSHTYVRTLIRDVRAQKGPCGKVALFCVHGFPHRPASRGIIGGRGLVAPGGPDDPLPSTTVGTQPPKSHRIEGCEVDGSLRIGEHIFFRCRSPIGGFVHFYNLGTSGTCLRLDPPPGCQPRPIHGGEEFRIPSAQSRAGSISIVPPPSSLHQEPERFLLIVTSDPVDLPCTELHRKLADRGESLARGGPVGPVRVDRARLFGLDSDSWEYGLLELDTLENS
jgi:hypothetical protein